MKELTLHVVQRPLPGGRAVKVGVYRHGGEPRLLVIAVGFLDGGPEDLADPRPEDRLVLPAAALPALREMLTELEEAEG